MKQVLGRLMPVLSTEQRADILEQGLRLLDQVGIECAHEEVCALAAKRAGVRYERGRLHFSPEVSRAHIELIRERAARNIDPVREHPVVSPPEDPSRRIRLRAVGPWTCLSVIDMDTGEYRRAELRDVAAATRLQVAMGVRGRKICAPVCPSDIPHHLQCLAMGRESWTYADDTGAGVASSVPEIELLWELGQIAGATPPYCYAEYAISPLTFNAHVLDMVYQLRNRPELDALAVDPGPIPTLGGTGPLNFRALLAQSVAETLGGSLMADIVTGGRQIPLCGAMTAVATDLRYGTVNFSSPESLFLLQAGFEVAAHLTQRTAAGGALRTMAKWPDAQAAAEKMMGALIGAMGGARSFCDAGQLSVDEVFSYEQFVLDVEILASVERFINGFPFETEPDPVELLREGLETKNFLDHPLTAENMRSYYWYPQIFEQRMLGPWQSAGAKSVVEKARDIARAKIDVQAPRVDDATLAKMNAVYERAAKTLQPVEEP